MYKHAKSIVNQREVGIDTLSYHNALVSAMREAPDVIMIGECRDRETFQARAAVRADRAPVPVHAAREQQLLRAQPRHQFVPARSARQPADGSLGEPESGDLAAPACTT